MDLKRRKPPIRIITLVLYQHSSLLCGDDMFQMLWRLTIESLNALVRFQFLDKVEIFTQSKIKDKAVIISVVIAESVPTVGATSAKVV